MGRLYHHDDSMYVMTNTVYVKGDAYAYQDEKKTKKISSDELHSMFILGMVIVDSGVEYKPVSCEVKGGVTSITYIKTVNGGSSWTVTPTVIKSEDK